MAEESITFLYGVNTSASLFHMNEKNVYVKDLSNISNLSRSSFKLSQNFSLLRMPNHSNMSGKKHYSVGFRLVSVCLLFEIFTQLWTRAERTGLGGTF